MRADDHAQFCAGVLTEAHDANTVPWTKGGPLCARLFCVASNRSDSSFSAIDARDSAAATFDSTNGNDSMR